MEPLSIQARPTNSTALPARPLSPPNLSSQTTDSFISQLEAQLSQPQLSQPQLSQPQAGAYNSSPQPPSGQAAGSAELRQAFQDFVGQTFFAEMIKACRSGQQPSAYFNGGRAEEIFQGQLDQVLSEELSKSSADKIADPMFELFMLKRQ
jgi:peptidoglycan hydrolase FlgJ